MDTLLVLAIVLLVLGLGACALFVWAVTSGRWVNRRELDTRAALHDRDYSVLTGERDGWRFVGLDIKAKLERAASIILELKAALIAAKEEHVACRKEYGLLVAELERLRHSNGTAQPEPTSTRPPTGAT